MRTSALRRFTPLPKTGKRADASRRARRSVWGDILQRSGWECEGCGISSRAISLEWAHLCGRPGSGMCLGDVADSLELTAALCADSPAGGRVGCHSIYDGRALAGTPLAEDLRAKLLRAAYVRLGGSVDGVECDSIGWRELIRQIVREREEAV